MDEKIRFKHIEIGDSFILHRESDEILLKVVKGDMESCGCCWETLILDGDGNQYLIDYNELVTLLT